MIDNSVTQFSGHLQIQDIEYADNSIIDYSIPYTDSIKQILNNIESIDYYFPRLQTGALASSGNASKISMVMGIDYQTEVDVIGLDKNVAEFYLDSNTVINIASNMNAENSAIFLKYKEKLFNSKSDLSESLFADGIDTLKYIEDIYSQTELPKVNFDLYKDEVLVGYKLAQYLNLSQGDSIILIGQGFRGATAVGKYKISGFLNFPIDQFNRLAVYMPIHTAHNFMSTYEINNNFDTTFYVNYVLINTKHSVSIRKEDYYKIINVKNEIENKLQNDLLTVIGWRELNTKLIETIEIGKGKSFIFISILYLVIAFGVLGTIIWGYDGTRNET